MATEYRKMFSASWKRAATLSGTWAAVVGAFSLIMNAVPDLTIILLLFLVPASLVVPAIIGFVLTKNYASSGKIETKTAASHGAITGVVYAFVMIIVALIFIVMNYLISALLWGEIGILMVGLIVVLATVLIGLPLMVAIGAICGAIGGAIYSSINK